MWKQSRFAQRLWEEEPTGLHLSEDRTTEAQSFSVFQDTLIILVLLKKKCQFLLDNWSINIVGELLADGIISKLSFLEDHRSDCYPSIYVMMCWWILMLWDNFRVVLEQQLSSSWTSKLMSSNLSFDSPNFTSMKAVVNAHLVDKEQDG